MGLGLALVVAVSAAAILGADGSKVNQGFADGAAVLVLVAAVATGIERILEAVWGFVDRSKATGAWWPLSVVTDAMAETERETDEAFRPFLVDAGAFVSRMTDTADRASDFLERKEAATREIAKQVADAAVDLEQTNQKLAPSSERFAIVTRTADELVSRTRVILDKYQVASDEIEGALSSAARAVNRAGDVIGSFSKNPARRLMSLAGGAILGLAVAGFLRLNMFVAVSGSAGQPEHVIGWGGVVLTGIIIGLGSSPTHEVIRALQRRQDETVTIPVADESPGTPRQGHFGELRLALPDTRQALASVRPARGIRRTS
jgi:hypothetical protein